MERAGEKSDADADDDDNGDDGDVDADDDDDAGDVEADDDDDAGEKSGYVDDDGDGCGKVGFRIFDQYCRHLLGPGDDSVEDINMKWVTLE